MELTSQVLCPVASSPMQVLGGIGGHIPYLGIAVKSCLLAILGPRNPPRPTHSPTEMTTFPWA